MSRYRRRRYQDYNFYPQSKSKWERVEDAKRKVMQLEKKGRKLSPVALEGTKIAKTFWGKAWCDNIESYRDYAHRLERGRSYVRSNSVIDLRIAAGAVTALIMGTSLYKARIVIATLSEKRWKNIRKLCAGKISSLIALLRGDLSEDVMEIMTRRDEGLFPKPQEISFECDCPDVAGMCKHLAAVMYGIGHRLDTQPELLFLLRGVDSADLIASAAGEVLGSQATAAGETIADDDLSDIFGVELENAESSPPDSKPPAKRKPGRPRKHPVTGAKAERVKKTASAKSSAADEAPVKRKPGRPRKHPVTGAKAECAKKTVLAKSTAADEAPVKRKPGRPRKTPVAVAKAERVKKTASAKSTAADEAPVKRKPGRPRKAKAMTQS